MDHVEGVPLGRAERIHKAGSPVEKIGGLWTEGAAQAVPFRLYLARSKVQNMNANISFDLDRSNGTMYVKRSGVLVAMLSPVEQLQLLTAILAVHVERLAQTAPLHAVQSVATSNA